MPAVDTRSDALKLEVSGVEIVHLRTAGTIHGVRILAAAPANGPGRGRLRTTGPAAALLSWKAPSSAAFGDDVDVSADGTYLIEDPDAGKWLRVQVSTAFLQSTPNEAEVRLEDVFGNGVSSDDVTAAEATAGDVETYTITMRNVSTRTLRAPRVWLDPAVSGLEISDDGVVWVSPTTEAAALLFADLAAAGTHTLHFKRTIGASAPSDPEVLNLLHGSYRARF